MSPLEQEARELRGRYDEEPIHSDHVAALALQIFDALRPWHELDSRLRELLQSGALLHDIGWSQTTNGRGHHKESARLIQAQGWKTLSADEVKLVAQIARYHRKSLPKPEHEPFQSLSATEQKIVLILAGILRIADALDRTHTGRVSQVGGAVSPEQLTVRVCTDGNWDEERAMFNVKRDMLELVAQRSVCCEAQ